MTDPKIAEQKMFDSPANFNQKVEAKRILVLSGGGAKGAYAFGCMKAFKEMGINFEAVAGTSVGALNAMLWSTDSMTKGEELWQNLSFSSIYPVKILNPKNHATWVIKAVSIALVIFNLTIAAVKRIPVPGRTVLCAIASLVIITPNVLVFCLANDLQLSYNFSLVVGIFFPLISFFICVQTDDPIHNANFFAFYLCCTWLLTTGVAFTLLESIFPNISSSKLVEIISAALVMILVATSVVAPWVFFITYVSDYFSKKRTILESAPLIAKLESILSESSMHIPTWVCAAHSKGVYDPDSPKWAPIYVTHSGVAPPGTDFEPVLKKAWCPSYLRLDTLSKTEASQFCAASAALPFGVVPPLSIHGIEYVDGGIIDNCPLISVYEVPGITEIFVVLLGAYESDEEALKKNNLTHELLQKQHRLLKVANYPVPSNVKYAAVPKKNKNSEQIINNDLAVNPAKIILIYPKKSLGGWFSGTLNFSPTYAAKIMNQGYSDASSVIKNLEGNVR